MLPRSFSSVQELSGRSLIRIISSEAKNQSGCFIASSRKHQLVQDSCARSDASLAESLEGKLWKPVEHQTLNEISVPSKWKSSSLVPVGSWGCKLSLQIRLRLAKLQVACRQVGPRFQLDVRKLKLQIYAKLVPSSSLGLLVLGFRLASSKRH